MTLEITEVRNVVTVSAATQAVTVTETVNTVEVGGPAHPQTHALDSVDHIGAISAAQHPVIASGDHHTEYGRKAAAEAISGAWTFSALLIASAHIQLGAAGEIRDSGGVARIKVATASPHVLLGSGTVDAGGRVRINDSLGIHAAAPATEYLRIDAGSEAGVIGIRGTKTGGVGVGVSLVNFQTIYDLAGGANAFAYPFNVGLNITDTLGGGSIADYSVFNVASNIQGGGIINRLSFFRFPHPAFQDGNIDNFSIFDVGDADEGLVSAGGSVLRIGDRGGADPSPWGSGSMMAGGYARPISQEWTTAAMLAISGGVGAFYNVFAGNITFGRNGAPAAGLLADFDSTVGGLGVPRMTTAQRDALAGPPPDGTIIYNTTIPSMQKRQGGAWVNF